MNILFILSLQNSGPGIASTRVEYNADYLRRMGNSVTVSCIFDPTRGGKPGSRYWNGIKIINYVPLILNLTPLTLVFNLFSLFFTSWIPYVIAKPDIVIISVPPGEASLGAFILAKLVRTKRIFFDYRDEWEDYAISNSQSKVFTLMYKILKTIMTKCYKKSNLVITVTESVSNKLSLRGVTNNRVISNGANTKIFKPNIQNKNSIRKKVGLDTRDFVLIHSGLLGEYYKIEVIVHAMKILLPKIPTLKLILIGGGSDIDNIMNLAENLGISENVKYLGKKNNRSDVADIVSASDVGVIPYHENHVFLNNAMPVKALEYLSCGIPILATTYRTSLLGRFIEENQIGLISPPENVQMLAENIYTVFWDRNFVSNASTRGISLIKERFDSEKLANELMNLVTEKR